MSPVFPSRVLDALEQRWTVVTASQRAARWLRRGFDGAQQRAGKSFWRPPAIYAWDTLLHLIWRQMVLEGSASGVLLNGSQQRMVWGREIEADMQSGGLSAESLAELAISGWTLAEAYRCREALPSRAESADTRAFARWAAAFARTCRREGYVSPEELTTIVAEQIATGDARLPEPGEAGLLLVGFDMMTPAQQYLAESLSGSGVPVERLEPQAESHGSRLLVRTEDRESERVVCARWLREFLKANPGAKAAIITANAEGDRPLLERTLRRVLAPEAEEITAAAAALPFEFSLGVPLAGVPLVSTALEVLCWMGEPLQIERVTSVLLSPYFAGGGEYLARAEFDAFGMRRERLLNPQLTVAATLELLRNWRSNGTVPELLHALRSLAKEAERIATERQQGFAAWADRFRQVLDSAGWGRAEGLDSVEFQAQRRWEAALDEMASLDLVGSRVGLREALAVLRGIAARTLFAPESQDAPVQIIGPLEAAGLEFGAVWFLGASDLQWPAGVSTHPLLPWGLQREMGMPGADPDREMELALTITGRIAASAPNVVFSYAAEADETTQRPSPVLAGLGLVEQRADSLVAPEPVMAPLQLIAFADETALPAPPAEGAIGGADLLKAQAACGFRAFAEKRLFSEEIEARGFGLDAMQRGSVIHDALERFWREVETQAALRTLSRDERTTLLDDVVRGALRSYVERATDSWAAAYLETERQRLMHLLGRWIEFESERSPFVVKAMEEPLRDVSIGPLRVSVRVDRIDVRLQEGEPTGEILLDYKTGSVKPADWLGNRPDEPQLPLYAVLRGGGDPLPLAAVAFVTIKAGDAMRLTGFADDKSLVGGRPSMDTEDLAGQVARWRDVLQELARQFHAGEAAVSPKKYPITCRYCGQRLLCRLDPTTLEPELREDMADQTTDSEAQSA